MHLYIKHRHKQKCGDSQREKGVRVDGGGQKRAMGTKRDFAWGGGHTMQYVDILLSCTL